MEPLRENYLWLMPVQRTGCHSPLWTSASLRLPIRAGPLSLDILPFLMAKRKESGPNVLWEKQQNARVHGQVLPDPAYPIYGVPVGSSGYQVHLRIGSPNFGQMLAVGEDDMQPLIEVLQGALAFTQERRKHS
jgi:hypothetical protein